MNEVRMLVDRKEHRFRRGSEKLDATGYFQTVNVPERDIEEDDIGIQRRQFAQRSSAITKRAHNFEPGFQQSFCHGKNFEVGINQQESSKGHLEYFTTS